MGGKLRLVAGHAGSGKTVYAAAKCSRERAVLLDANVTTDPLVQAALQLGGELTEEEESAAVRDLLKPASYRCLMDTAILAARYGATVFVVASFADRLSDSAWVRRLELDAQEHGIKLDGVWLEPSRMDRRLRLENRAAQRDRRKLEHLTEWMDGLTIPPLPTWMRLHRT